MSKSAYNRYQESKAFRKALVIAKKWGVEDVTKCANRIKDNRQKCSCYMCCNPRHSPFSKGKEKLTIQERKQNHE